MSEAAAVPGFDNISSFRKITSVYKRNGKRVPFDIEKVRTAISKAMTSSREGAFEDAQYIARKVVSSFQRAGLLARESDFIPSVEAIQDAIERELMIEGFTKTAKHFILYRDERNRVRQEVQVPEHVKKLATESKTFFPNSMSEFVYYRTYSRWIEEEGRRETWIETVERYMAQMRKLLGDKLDEFSNTDVSYSDIQSAITSMEVMPSMRLMWAAGSAVEATNVAAFNCSFIAPTCVQDLGEILYILACGTGVGFAVESQNVQQFPVVRRQIPDYKAQIYVIADSKEGWANALVLGMRAWYDGLDIQFDFRELRPEGARLKTMGGRSSGPKPLQDLLVFTRSVMLSRQGRRLSNLDMHDIICKIGDCIVAGGVRRSALISLSDLDDQEMRRAKEGHFYISNNQRQLANNSAVYNEKPSPEKFLDEWLSLIKSHSGERGIFNRGSLLKQIPVRRRKVWEEIGAIVNGEVVAQVGTNPCGEITLLSKQFCNLTEVVCRVTDNADDLARKVRIATVLGTYQSMLTNYPYLSKEWKENCEKERLLGVSLTGQWDCPTVRDPGVLKDLRNISVVTNAEYAEKFGINPSTSVTCGKPSGTVSQLVDAASGGHARYSPYYIRRFRISSSDPLFKMLRDQGLPYFPDVGQTYDTATTFVFEFPVHSPSGPYSRDLTALDQLEYWKSVKTQFTEHNPSVTISVGQNEWLEVGHWVWQNWDIIGGLSFLPREDHVYQLAPYEECTKEKYQAMLSKFHNLDYSKIMTYEREDTTQGSKEFACVGGVCEIQ